jgi:hypothetical protein
MSSSEQRNVVASHIITVRTGQRIEVKGLPERGEIRDQDLNTSVPFDEELGPDIAEWERMGGDVFARPGSALTFEGQMAQQGHALRSLKVSARSHPQLSVRWLSRLLLFVMVGLPLLALLAPFIMVLAYLLGLM